MKKVLITGGTGFIGSKLANTLRNSEQYDPIIGVRKKTPACSDDSVLQIGNIASDTIWSDKLSNVAIVVHLAARVHVMQDKCTDPLIEYRKVNTEGTLNLARQAANAGVKRFIFLSSIKVNGEYTNINKPFTPEDTYITSDPYGLSKYEAEQGLKKLAETTEMDVVIIRPPLVYGPGVKANFLNMMVWLDKGIPLPLGAINNQRSLVSLNNLIDFIITCINHPAASNQVFLVSDNHDLSTTALLRCLGIALEKPARLLPVPQRFLIAGLSLVGKQKIAQRLCSSLHVDISKTKSLLNWTPPYTIEQSLKDTVKFYSINKSN